MHAHVCMHVELRNAYIRFKMASKTVIQALFIVCAVLLQDAGFATQGMSEVGSTFRIDYDNDCFAKDGQPFRYASGSFHYFRVPSAFWDVTMKRMRAAGLNALQTYVAWNIHETQPGVYNFEGDRDIEYFLYLARENNLLVILRPGPFIDAEWEFGGFPSWMLKEKDIVLRSSDARYLKYVETWFGVLLRRVKPFLYQNGGPVVMVQVENEYGSYGCDHEYLRYLRSLVSGILGSEVVLFTTNGCDEYEMQCGSIPELYSTVDFGTGDDAEKCLKLMRALSPHGPLVNSEFYTGWEDFWGNKKSKVNSKVFARSLDSLLSMGNVSVNMYMFEGGTNFGFMNGADISHDMLYKPEITSYDYDAPLTEAGDTTEKFDLVRQVLGKHIPLPPAHLPPNAPKTAYGRVPMTEYCSFFDAPLITRIADGIDPITMEDLDQSYGYVLYAYRENLSPGVAYELSLRVHDRAYVFVDRNLESVLQRANISQEVLTTTVSVPQSGKGELKILVENQGRVCYVPRSQHLSPSSLSGSLLSDRKGILGSVSSNGNRLDGWISSSVPMNSSIPDSIFKSLPSNGSLPGVFPSSAMLFRGELPSFPKGTTANDTYLMLTGWTKGVVFVNNFNIGRYWSAVPPQRTLYVPSSLLRAGGAPNAVVVFEQDHSPCSPPLYKDCFVTFLDKPVFV